MEELRCDDDVQLALKHINNKQFKLGIDILKKYEGCHLTNLSCTYCGDDCMMQDLISGYAMWSNEMADE